MPSIRSRRVVSDGGLHLSVAYDLTCFTTFFALYESCSKHTLMTLSMVPSIRSRRVVSNGGPHLSVAYDLTCFMTYFELSKLCIKNA